MAAVNSVSSIKYITLCDKLLKLIYYNIPWKCEITTRQRQTAIAEAKAKAKRKKTHRRHQLLEKNK